MLTAMAYTTLKLHKSEYETHWLAFRGLSLYVLGTGYTAL